MIPARYEQITFIFFVTICMSCVVNGVSVLNTAGYVDTFFGLWITAWLKSWIVAFPSVSIIAPLVSRVLDKLVVK